MGQKSPVHQSVVCWLWQLQILLLLLPAPLLTVTPSKSAKAIPLLTYVKEMLRVNVSQVDDNPDWGFLWFSSAPAGKWQHSTLNWPWTLPFTSFPVHYSPVILPLIPCILSCWWHFYANHKLINSALPPVEFFFLVGGVRALGSFRKMQRWHAVISISLSSSLKLESICSLLCILLWAVVCRLSWRGFFYWYLHINRLSE